MEFRTCEILQIFLVGLKPIAPMSRDRVILFVSTLTFGGTTEKLAKNWVNNLPDTKFHTISYDFISCSYFQITLQAEKELTFVSPWFTTDLHNCPRLRKEGCDVCCKLSLASLISFGRNQTQYCDYILQTLELNRVGIPLLGLKEDKITGGLYPR